VTEDYSSYESVEEEEEPKKFVSTKKGSGNRTVGAKKEDSNAESVPPEDATVNLTSNSESKSKANAKIGTLLAKTAPSRSMDTKKGQKQKTLNTFFGVPRPKK